MIAESVKARVVRRTGVTVALVCALALAACTHPDPEQVASGQIFDPYEDGNRSVHAFNRGIDRFLFRPTAKGYSGLVPDPIEDSVGYFSENLSMPGNTVNALLQADWETAGWSIVRFVMNSTIGFAGLADPATEFGVPPATTDFGETLHVWGVRQGAYIELPILGPSTERDAVGILVDFFTNPLTYVLPAPQDDYGIYAEVLERLGDRGRFSDTVDSILYESADSYAQARLIYLQNRRFELGQEDPGSEIDPFALDTEGF